MKNKILIPLFILGALATFFSFKYSGAEEITDQRKQVVIQAVMKAIKEGHFTPRDINDSFSAKVYDKIIEQLDYEKKFFTQADVAALNDYRYKLDDEINNNSLAFYNKANELFVKRVEATEAYYKEILSTPFSFKSNDQIELDYDKVAFAANEVELKNRWKTYLKFKVLQKYTDLKKEQDGTNDKDAVEPEASPKVKKTDAELEIAARESVRKLQERYYKRLKNIDDDDRFSAYVNAITLTEDPHTDYFPPQQKKSFDEQMSGSFFGIGAQLKEEDEGVRITEVLPGFPAHKQGELKAKDLIIKVGQASGEPVEVQGMEIDEVIRMIKGPKGTEVRLTVRKPDGSVRVIPIVRDKVEREELFAKSAIINSEGGPVGYIYLPEFYADFAGTNGGRACAEDVAKEVEKLKNAGVTGIILDLRYNGGGSLGDVVDMAGLFIDNGPVVQVKTSTSTASTLRDRVPGTLYDGPMAIMVNTGSASASEIMAAAMQDYKRAVIVGTPTFGKGTVQKVIPLDNFVDPMSRGMLQDDDGNGASIGSLKLTVQKFYRINGGSTQLKGVTPDIILPDPYKYIDMGERRDKAALPWDEIPAARYQPSSNPVNVKALAAASQKRISANPTFGLMEESALRIKKQDENNVYSLNEVLYRKQVDEASALSKKVEELEKKGTPLVLTNPKEDMAKINSDSVNVKKNSDWLKRLGKDMYVAETVNIINDMNKPGMKVNIGTGMK